MQVIILITQFSENKIFIHIITNDHAQNNLFKIPIIHVFFILLFLKRYLIITIHVPIIKHGKLQPN